MKLWKYIKIYSNKIKITILRFGITYSNRKNGGSAVESIFKQIKDKQKITIGSLQTSRRFIHVSDIVLGILKAIKYNKGGIFNLVGQKDITLKKIILNSQRILNKKVKVYSTNQKPSIRIVKII